MSSDITLIPVGPVEASLLEWLGDQLAQVLQWPVTTGQAITLPEDAYDLFREQYRGEDILKALRRLSYPSASRLLGLVDADCFAPGLNFIFGQASIRGREAFIALPRLRQSFYGLPSDLDLFRQRVLKEAVHELGHTWGLPHCPNPHCVMHFSNSLQDTDTKGTQFCTECQNRLNA